MGCANSVLPVVGWLGLASSIGGPGLRTPHGTEVTLDGADHLILERTDLLAVVRSVAAAAA